MNKTILFLFFTMITQLSYSQMLYIHTNAAVDSFYLDQIDSITFNCPMDTVTGTMEDIDGNIYSTVKIGNQWWMAENLKVTHYRNGEAIPLVTDNNAWSGLNSGAYCNYNNDQVLNETYGRLYNWSAVNDSRNIAPVGWHVPTDEEWKELEMFLGMSQSEADATGERGTDEGGKLKESGIAHWNDPNTGATNASRFTALPGGVRKDYNGAFEAMNITGLFWTATPSASTEAYSRILRSETATIQRSSGQNRPAGLSVRLVKD